MSAPLRDEIVRERHLKLVEPLNTTTTEPRLTVVEPLRPRIEIVDEPRSPRIPDDVPEQPRPTLARPQLGATGLFQGWGPRLR